MPDTNANDHPLTGQRVAILATDGFEESELREPLKALQSAGAEVAIVAPSNTLRPGEIRGWNNDNWSPTPLKIDVQLEAANPDNYDALVLPGGVRNPDKLRVIPRPSSSSATSSSATSPWPPSATPPGFWSRPTLFATAPSPPTSPSGPT